MQAAFHATLINGNPEAAFGTFVGRYLIAASSLKAFQDWVSSVNSRAEVKDTGGRGIWQPEKDNDNWYAYDGAILHRGLPHFLYVSPFVDRITITPIWGPGGHSGINWPMIPK